MSRLVNASVFGVVVFFAPMVASAGEALQFDGHVVVGPDGNGVTAATFPTTVAGELVVYYLVMRQGAVPVNALQVTLNSDVVFQTALFAEQTQRVEVGLHPVGGDTNEIQASATGSPGSEVEFAVIAFTPPIVLYGGSAVLPRGRTNALLKNSLTFNNQGPNRMFVRIVFFKPDGTFVGRTPLRELPAHATAVVDLGATARTLGLDWTAGPVELRWVSNGPARLSAISTVVQFAPDAGGNLVAVGTRDLNLDETEPRKITQAEYNEIANP